MDDSAVMILEAGLDGADQGVGAFRTPLAASIAFAISRAVNGRLGVIEQMVRRLGLTWTESVLDRFRQRARCLVREERRAITVLADVLLEWRTMTSDEIGVLLSAVTTPRALWVVA